MATKRVNVTDQSREPDSLLNRLGQIIRARRDSPEFGWGEFSVIAVDSERVLGLRADWRNNAVLALHNLSCEPCTVTLDLGDRTVNELTDVLSDQEYPPLDPTEREIPLSAYGYRWLRLKGTRR